VVHASLLLLSVTGPGVRLRASSGEVWVIAMRLVQMAALALAPCTHRASRPRQEAVLEVISRAHTVTASEYRQREVGHG
jgi:hypothetical protein